MPPNVFLPHKICPPGVATDVAAIASKETEVLSVLCKMDSVARKHGSGVSLIDTEICSKSLFAHAFVNV